MNQPQKRIIASAIAGILFLFVLALVLRYSLRESSRPIERQSPQNAELQPRQVAPVSAFPDEPQPETPTASQTEESTVTNAATLYRQAFALYDALSRDEKDLLRDWRTNVDAAVEAELCEKIRPICEIMHQATAVTNCDWGVKRPFKQNTVEQLVPDLNSSHGIARAAIWSAAHCRKDDTSQAISDLAATSRLGHDMPPLLIGYLVDLAIQGRLQDFVANHAHTIADSNDPRLLQMFKRDQFEEPMYRAFEGEMDLSSKPLPAMSDQTKSDLASLYPLTKSMDKDQVNEYIFQAHDWELQYVKAVQLPEAEYQQWLARLHEAEKTNPLLERLVSYLDSTVEKARLAIIRSDMVIAGLAITRDGPGALQAHPDPATDQPFLYTETSDGFELRSGYDTNSLALRMQFK
jgi:hypothetical protein